MKTLYLIPARGGSKGIPGKNIKNFAGKPLLYYSIDCARAMTSDEHICLSTDDDEIRKTAEQYQLSVHFVRPVVYATDTASSREVILHALDFYLLAGVNYDVVVLLQPTSPFRKPSHIREALDLYDANLDMVVSVKETKANPYFSLYEETQEGFLEKSKSGQFTRRQDCPHVYQLNGAIYAMTVRSVRENQIGDFKRTKKYLMDELHSADLDTMLDWDICEYLVKSGKIKLSK